MPDQPDKAPKTSADSSMNGRSFIGALAMLAFAGGGFLISIVGHNAVEMTITDAAIHPVRSTLRASPLHLVLLPLT